MLEAGIMADLLKSINPHRKNLRLYMMIYDLKNRKSLEDHALIVKSMLEQRNKVQDLQLFYSEKTKELDLSNKVF